MLTYLLGTHFLLMGELDLYWKRIATHHPAKIHYPDLSGKHCGLSPVNTGLPIATIQVGAAKKFHRNWFWAKAGNHLLQIG